MRRPLFATIIALAAFSASARPSYPLTGYAGSAWFNTGSGITVVGATYAECQQKLQDGINYRVSNWGWAVTSITPCRNRAYAEVRDLEVYAAEPEASVAEAAEYLERDSELRARFQIDAYEKALDAAFPVPNMCEAK